VGVPFIHVSIVEGFSEAEQRRLLSGLTDAVVTSLGIPEHNVAVVLNKVPADAWAAGGVPVNELQPPAK